ncbi:MAG: sugar ABC transporter substrate-binding protein [Candidatus Promineifilaceae bacterium]|nr:sugar ABC transporter substrate-binding protein [Candidatus Promineifilaceae bacterium]
MGIRTRRYSRRQFLGAAAAAGAGATLAGCLPRTSTGVETDRQIQLVYQDWRTDWFPPMVQGMLAEFHAQHPHIRVFYVPDPPDVETSLVQDMERGTAPDVFAACCSFFPILAQQGHTLDLQPFVSADLDQATIADWDPAQYWTLFTRDGRQYGLPKYHGALALYYNKDLFDEYGVSYPDDSWTDVDYLAAMRQLTRDRDGDGQVDLWGSMVDVSWERLQVHVNGWGGHFVDPDDPRRSLMCEPAALAAIEWLRARIWDDGVMASPLNVNNLSTRQAFIQRRVAMIEDGSWALRDILSQADFRIGVAPFPAGPAGRVTLTTTDGFGIYAGTRHPEAAWELVKFLTSKTYGRAMARANFLQPARASLLPDWMAFIRAEFPAQTRGLDLEAFAAGHVQGYSVTAETFANMADATAIAYAAWDDILTLGQAPTTRLKEACRLIEAAQARLSEASLSSR